MLFNSAAAVAVLAAVSQVAALKPMPYKPVKRAASIEEMFGVMRRQTGGYTPTEHLCGRGDTCQEACGPNYRQCASSDSSLHCYQPGEGQICCPDKTGNACDAGYFCSADKEGDTYCCPNEMSLTQCAEAYGVTGLQSQVPETTLSSSTETPIATYDPTTSPTSSAPSTYPEAPTLSTTSPSAPPTSPTPTISNPTLTTPYPSSLLTTKPSGNGNGTVTKTGYQTSTSTYCPGQCTDDTTKGGNGDNGGGSYKPTGTGGNNYSTTAGSPSSTSSLVTVNAGVDVKPLGAVAMFVAGAFVVLL